MSYRVSRPDDPDRCQGTNAEGRCWYSRDEGSDYCPTHGGGRVIDPLPERQMYHLQEVQYQQRLAQLSGEHDPVEALYDVLAVTRLIINKRLNATAFQQAELLDASADIAALQMTVERVQRSANTIEQNLRVFVTKPTVLSVGRLLIQIVAEELQGIENYEQRVLSITRQISNTISAANNQGAHRIKLPTKPTVLPRTPLFVMQDPEDQVRLQQLREHDGARLLREDIGLAIMLIQNRLDYIKTPNDLCAQALGLNQQLRGLERLFKSAHDLEQIVGTLLTQDIFHMIGQAIEAIFKDELSDQPNFEDVVERIAVRFEDTLANKEAAKQRLLGMDSPQTR